MSNEDIKTIETKENKGKTYRHKYYEKNKEKLALKQKDRSESKFILKLKLEEDKEKFVPEMKIFEKKYNNIESNKDKLIAIRNDFRVLRYTLHDESSKYNYTKGTYMYWLLELNELLKRQTGKITSEVLSKVKLQLQ